MKKIILSLFFLMVCLSLQARPYFFGELNTGFELMNRKFSVKDIPVEDNNFCMFENATIGLVFSKKSYEPVLKVFATGNLKNGNNFENNIYGYLNGELGAELYLSNFMSLNAKYEILKITPELQTAITFTYKISYDGIQKAQKKYVKDFIDDYGFEDQIAELKKEIERLEEEKRNHEKEIYELKKEKDELEKAYHSEIKELTDQISYLKYMSKFLK